MLTGSNLLENLFNRGGSRSRSHRCGGTLMHQIDHRDGCVRFSQYSGDGRKSSYPEAGAAQLGR